MKVRLVISKTHHPEGRYITLSHRWERIMRVKLQSSNMAQMLTEVAISSLTPAFQDAIAITRHLNIDYIWIDALCIVQDEDESDWKIESQYMDKVYSNAFLNLSATMSSTGTEPLITERYLSSLEPSKINLFDSVHEDYYIVDSQMWMDEVDDAPLNQRGWVFQERFLARRIVHFGLRQLAWECNESEALEASPDGLHEYSTLTSMSKPRAYKSIRHLPPERGEIWAKDFSKEYHILVHNYSKCKLTRLEDKLIAFSGIPRSIQEYRDDFYVAGVWKSSLPLDLNWYCDLFDEEGSPNPEAPFGAPSWSWASVTGEVYYPPGSEAAAEIIFIANWTFLSPKKLKNDSSIDRTAIKLEGLLLPVEIEWSDADISCFRISGLQFDINLVAPAEPSIDLDGPDEKVQISTRDGNTYWIPLSASKEDIHGILVSKFSRSLKVRRLGRIQVPLLNKFQRLEQGGAQESDQSVRMTRSKRRRLNEARKGSNKEDSRGRKLIEVIKSKQPLAITLV
jgi:hypothetical protein